MYSILVKFIFGNNIAYKINIKTKMKEGDSLKFNI